MEKDNRNALQRAAGHILDYDLATAISDVREFINANPYLMNTDEMTAIADDFERMTDYMRRGYADPERNQLYTRLLQRLYSFGANLNMAYRIKTEPLFMTVNSTVNSAMTDGLVAASFTHENIRHELENFVANVAMLQLDTDGQHHSDDANTPRSREKQLYNDHYRYMNTLFCRLFIADQWRSDDADFYKSLLVSPTVETVDAQLLTSAIGVACLAQFDIEKLTTLLYIYQNTDIETVKQRALVGWTLALSDTTAIYPEQERLIADAVSNDETAQELVDLQQQMIFCLRTEDDSQDIKRNIIPSIVKNNNLSITRDGIIEKDDDPMDDILGSSDADKRMEEMENSIRKMLDMQKQGSDIYFGGFSQMKRFSFFYTLSNWFTPFSTKHPALLNIVNKTDDTANMKVKEGILESLVSRCPFCDSDKYSFALALSSIIDRLPANIREMLGNAGSLMPSDESIDFDSPAYIRRMYLQDLYRFFRLYPQRNSLRCPFSQQLFAFTTANVFRNTAMSAHAGELCRLFYKNDLGDALQLAAYQIADDDDPQALFYRGLYEYYYGDDESAAVPHWQVLHTQEPDNERITRLLASAYMKAGNYKQASELYETLYLKYKNDEEHQTTRHKATINYCSALVKLGNFDTAAPLLFQLQFEFPDDANVLRLLAWTLMEQGKYDDADKQYSRLADHPRHTNTDNINAAYCKWLIGDIPTAVSLFKSFIGASSIKAFHKEILNDSDMLKRHNISRADIMLMQHIVEHEA